MISNFHPKPHMTLIPFGEIMEQGLPCDLSPFDCERWNIIPQGGNFEALPLRLRVPGTFSYVFRKLDSKRPSYTLPSTIPYTGAFFHPTEPRHISLREKVRIASFPDICMWVGNDTAITACVGNSVPPKLMQHIAEYIGDTLLHLSTEERRFMPLDFINKSLKPFDTPLFTVISTFSGGGGSSLGYIWAGGKVLAAIEWDANAVATYKLNFPDTLVLHRDITTVTVEEVLQLTGLRPGELDILDGSPPCVGFSSAGKRRFDDPRNSLFREYVRLLRGLQPKVFVMENVSGMVKGHMKHIFALIMRELKASGYQVKCQLMNAMYFGVPQSRERVIFIGVRNDLHIEPSHPPPLMQPVGALWLDDRAARYSDRRYGDALEVPGKPISTVTRIGRKFWTRSLEFGPLSYAINTSFPQDFRFLGSLTDCRARVGNTVPPMFMKSLADHVYKHFLFS